MLRMVEVEKRGVRILCPSCLEEVEKEGICEKCKSLYRVRPAAHKIDNGFPIQMRDFICPICRNEVTMEDFGKPVLCPKCRNLVIRKFQKPLVYELTEDLRVVRTA